MENRPGTYRKDTYRLQRCALGDVTLLDGYEANAFRLECSYLRSLDPDRLLKGFCDIASVSSSAKRYGGWESAPIQGHTLGHYLTAVSQAYATSGDGQWKALADYIVSVLAQCQDPETGYLAAIPESHYDQIQQGNPEGTWVPWYTMHKVMSGILAAYEYTANFQALTVAARLGDWISRRTAAWTEQMKKRVWQVEYGGMNDCLYQLYRHTKSAAHLAAAHSFDELPLFDSLYAGEDVLEGKHANTTIPKIIGALNRYALLGQTYYLQVAKNFWDIVVADHTYITGGNSQWEHFGKSGVLDGERTNCNCETCNSYNMLKLTQELFLLTGEKKYLDYYENTFINGILSSQNPQTGMTTYFQPMASGYFKVYSSPEAHFWCCTGTGMENFSKMGNSIYYTDGESLYVCRFSSSRFFWREKNLTILQTASLPKVKLQICGEGTADIVLRIPDWCCGNPGLRVNGKAVATDGAKDFIHLTRRWHTGDVIEYTVSMEVRLHRLPDNPDCVAFRYGPWVLSANMGKTNMQTTTTGVDVTIPVEDPSAREEITILDVPVEEWCANAGSNVLRRGNTEEFTLKGTDCGLIFSPHYLQYENRYGIYFRLKSGTKGTTDT